MASSRIALSVVCLTLAGLWYGGGGTAIPAVQAEAETVSVSPPATHENLAVYFVMGPDSSAAGNLITLQEALESGCAIVHETGDVNTLTVENRSPDCELFIQEGDIIRGGRQDRMIAGDMLLPPKSGVASLPCHCVEQGRWTNRGAEPATHFNKCDQFVNSSGLKYANATRQQGEVWANVAEEQQKLARSTRTNVNSALSASSLQLTLENPTVKAGVSDYESALREQGDSSPNIVGVVFFVNGQLSGAELYGSNRLFRKAWPKLLRAAATEALAEKRDRAMQLLPSHHQVARFLAHPEQYTGASSHDVQTTITNSVNEVEMIPIRALPSGQQLLMRNAQVQTQVQIDDRRIITPSGSAQIGPNNPVVSVNSINADEIVRLQSNLETNLEELEAVRSRNTALETRAQFGLAATTLNPSLAPSPAQPAARQDGGNRLSVNRVENPTALVTESRDVANQNALIHKSYIKVAMPAATTPAVAIPAAPRR